MLNGGEEHAPEARANGGAIADEVLTRAALAEEVVSLSTTSDWRQRAVLARQQRGGG